MGRTIILVLILISALKSIGQDFYRPGTTKQKFGHNEIGINIFNITGNSHSYISTLNQHFIVGLMYKHRTDKNAIRIGFDYYYSKFSNERDGGYSYLEEVGKDNIGELRVGFERQLTTTRLQLFVGTDLTLTYGQVKGMTRALGDFYPFYTETQFEFRIAEIGIAPAVGFDYRLSKKLSIAMESNVSLAYHYRKNLVNSKTSTSPRFYFNPLRLFSLNYHFRIR